MSKKATEGKKVLNFIIGREGVGKTSYARSLLGSFVGKGEKTMLIVPKQFTFESDKGILDALGPRLASEVEVLSFTRLADTVFKTCRGVSKPLLRDTAATVMMSLALDALEEKLSFFSRHRSSTAFAQKMLSQIALFKKEAIEPEELFEAAEKLPEGLLKKKTVETALIYETYNALVAQSFFDDRDMLSAVCEILLDSDLFDGKIVVIDDFRTFSGQELKIIELMLRRAKEVWVTLCTDELFVKSSLSPFCCVSQTAKRLVNSAEKNGVRIGKTVLLRDGENGFSVYSSPELRYLEKNFFDVCAEPFEDASPSIRIINASDVREECSLVACEIHRLLREEKLRCRDIAVVYRSESAYQKEIRYSLKKYGVPIFEDRHAEIKNEPLSVLVRTVFEILAFGIDLERLMTYSKTGLTSLSWDEIAQIENYAFMWNLDSKALCGEWKDNPDGFGSEMNERRQERLTTLNAAKDRLVAPLIALREKLKGKSAVDCLKGVFEFILEEKIDENLKNYALELESQGEIELALQQEQVWDSIVGVFDDLAAALNNADVSQKKLCELFSAALSCLSLGKLPSGYDEVYICDAGRIQTLMPKVIFVVGANEGVFPLPGASEGIFSLSESETLRESLPLFSKSAADFSAEERFMVYNSLCSAREKLYVSYSLTDKSGAKILPSEIVTGLRRLFPKISEKAFPFSDGDILPESESAAFEFAAENWHEDTVLEKTLKEYFSSKPEYSGRLRALSRANGKNVFSFENPEKAQKLFGKRLSLSASQLEVYGECPFKYFCRYGMGAKERRTASLDPASMGTVVHTVLEKLLKKHSGERIHSLTSGQARQEIKTLLKEYLDTYMGGVENKSSRFIYLYDRLFKTLCAITDRLLCEFEGSDFEPFDFELPIKEGTEVEPMRIPLKNGYIELFGVVDRVDMMKTGDRNYIRVVDYKTGLKEFSLADVFAGLGMQMLLYLASIWKNGKGKYENTIPSGVLYLPARLEAFSADRGEDEKAVFQKMLSGGKMDGMILDDGEVIKGMDNALCGQFIPIKINKRTGAMSGKFISLSQLEALEKKLEKIMSEMGNSLHEGKIPALPVFGKGHDKTCEWCPYASVCMREKNGRKRYIAPKTHSECLSELEEEEG